MKYPNIALFVAATLASNASMAICPPFQAHGIHPDAVRESSGAMSIVAAADKKSPPILTVDEKMYSWVLDPISGAIQGYKDGAGNYTAFKKHDYTVDEVAQIRRRAMISVRISPSLSIANPERVVCPGGSTEVDMGSYGDWDVTDNQGSDPDYWSSVVFAIQIPKPTPSLRQFCQSILGGCLSANEPIYSSQLESCKNGLSQIPVVGSAWAAACAAGAYKTKAILDNMCYGNYATCMIGMVPEYDRLNWFALSAPVYSGFPRRS